jgi:hypothetical protein
LLGSVGGANVGMGGRGGRGGGLSRDREEPKPKNRLGDFGERKSGRIDVPDVVE